LHGEALAAGIGIVRSDLLTHLCQYPICVDLFPNADHSVNGQPAISNRLQKRKERAAPAPARCMLTLRALPRGRIPLSGGD